MAKKRLNPAIRRSRTRSGCLTCRDRHMKCDEQLPVCKNCIKSKRKCYRGIRLNFTQYTMYNPQDQSPPPDFSEVQTQFGLLDQSITIASLYHNGKRSYEPYLHLHKPEDLNESDLQYQQDIFCSMPFTSISLEDTDELINSPILSKSGSSSNFDNNFIHENFAITNTLLDDRYVVNRTSSFEHNTESTDLPPVSKELSASSDNEDHKDAIPDLSYSLDVQSYVNLIEHEKYYWALDLFNELRIWKTVIPTYCLESDGGKDLFLIDCLLNCSVKSKMDLDNLLQLQLSLWYNARAIRLVHNDNIHKFEKILISICLILLSIFRNIQKENCTTYIKIILNNQVKIFNKVIAKLEEYLRFKKSKSIILISSIQSIVILKFFLLKKFEIESKIVKNRQQPLEDPKLARSQENDQEEKYDVSEDLQEQIEYPQSRVKNEYVADGFQPSVLTKLNSFEIANLNRSFKKYDYLQTSYMTLSMTPRQDSRSDAYKLREFLWYVIKLNHVIHNPDNKLIEIDYNFIFQSGNVILPNIRLACGSVANSTTSSSNLSDLLDDTNSSQSGSNRTTGVSAMAKYRIVFPNERGVATNLLREFIRKQINIGSSDVIHEANHKIYTIFRLIQESVLEKGIKAMWKSNFAWVLQQATENMNKPQEKIS